MSGIYTVMARLRCKERMLKTRSKTLGHKPSLSLRARYSLATHPRNLGFKRPA